MPTPLRGKTEAGDARPFTFQLYRYSAFDNRGSRLAKNDSIVNSPFFARSIGGVVIEKPHRNLSPGEMRAWAQISYPTHQLLAADYLLFVGGVR